MITSTSLATSGGLLGLKNSVNHLVSIRICMLGLFTSEDKSLISSVVLDSAATLFTLEVFCGLKPFTHRFIGMRVST